MTHPAPLWLFDLDNTLHNASHTIFPAIHSNMNRYIAQVLGEERGEALADADAVNAAREKYWKRYGATLLGMVKHHAVRAEDFLREAHDFDDLPTMIRAERGLIRLLQGLPGRKILLTNAPQHYAQKVTRQLGLHRHFERQISIESMYVHRQLRPKPSRLLLRKLLAREGAAAHRCILVEDTIDTLKAAKAIGLQTVWVTGYLPRLGQQRKRPTYIDVKVKSVLQLSRQLHRLRS